MINFFIGLGFITPIAVVFAMNIIPKNSFNGHKTNVQAQLLLVIAGIQTADFSFIPSDVETALVAGAGFAILIASNHMTERTGGK